MINDTENNNTENTNTEDFEESLDLPTTTDSIKEEDNTTATESTEEPSVVEKDKKQTKEEVEPGYVPIRAVQDERTKRQALEHKLKVLSERFDQVIDAMVSGKKPEQEKEEDIKLPDFTVDPLGHLKVSIGLLAEQLKSISEKEQKRSIDEANNNIGAALTSRWQTDIQNAAAKDPDFIKAVDFLAKARFAELDALGYSQKEALAIISNEAREIAEKSYKEMDETGTTYNAAERLAKLAKLRGFNSTTVVRKKDPTTLRNISGGAVKAPASISAEFIDSLSEDEYAEFMKGRDWRKLNQSR